MGEERRPTGPRAIGARDGKRQRPGKRFGDPGHPPELGYLHQWQRGQAPVGGHPSRQKLTAGVKLALRIGGKLQIPDTWLKRAREAGLDIDERSTIEAAIATRLLRDAAASGDRFAISQILAAEPKELVIDADLDLAQDDLADRLDALAQAGGASSLPVANGRNGSNGSESDSLQ